MTRSLLLFATMLGLSACVALPPQDPQPGQPAARPASGAPLGAQAAVDTFVAVVARVEPVAEHECRARAEGGNCDFEIVVDTRPGQPPNAFQTLGPDGRPILAFTAALIADMRNADEIAFILGHEAAHHIANHIPRMQTNAALGGALGGLVAAAIGADTAAVDTFQSLGATVGARRYSKDFELEADRLGTVIAWRAGYDPLVGAAYFERVPDPGDRFLGSHPPNAARIETVRRTLAGLR